jgi:hypothetical protein
VKPASFGRGARLEDDDRRLSRTSGCIAVEVLVQLTPTLPQPVTLPADCGSAEHPVHEQLLPVEQR